MRQTGDELALGPVQLHGSEVHPRPAVGHAQAQLVSRDFVGPQRRGRGPLPCSEVCLSGEAAVSCTSFCEGRVGGRASGMHGFPPSGGGWHGWPSECIETTLGFAEVLAMELRYQLR